MLWLFNKSTVYPFPVLIDVFDHLLFIRFSLVVTPIAAPRGAAPRVQNMGTLPRKIPHHPLFRQDHVLTVKVVKATNIKLTKNQVYIR